MLISVTQLELDNQTHLHMMLRDVTFLISALELQLNVLWKSKEPMSEQHSAKKRLEPLMRDSPSTWTRRERASPGRIRARLKEGLG